MKKYFYFFENLTNNNILVFSALIIFTFCILLYHSFRIDKLPLLIISNIAGVYTLVSIIKKMDGSKFINNKTLNYIGNKSLEIYLIHFFLLELIKKMDLCTFTDKSLLMNFLFVLSISIIVISISLLTATIFKKSSVLNKIIFGNK